MAKLNKSLMTSNSEEYETPEHIYGLFNNAFNFSLDAAASKKNTKCKHFYTKEDDALIQDWAGFVEEHGGSVWLNPPYGQKIAAFMEKAWNEYLKGASIVCLVPARTDTKWFQDYAMRGSVVFLRGRLRFGGGESSAPFPSAIVIYDSLISYQEKDRDFEGIGKWL